MGRRGTGKTYLLRMLERQLFPEKCCIIHVDCRTLCTWNADTLAHLDSNSASRIGLHFFWNFLREVRLNIHRCPYFKAGLFNTKHPIDTIENLSAITAVPSAYEQQNEASVSRQKNLSGSLSATKGVSLGFENGHEEKIQQKASYRLSEQIRPAEIYNAFNAELEQHKVQVFILIDEWSSLPSAVQPYVADLIKRCLLPCKWICFKIAAVELQSSFRIPDGRGYIGLDLGAEIKVDLELDNRYVFELKPVDTIRYFTNLLYTQVKGNLQDDYLPAMGCYTISDFITRTFHDQAAVIMLVKICGGNARDLISIFNKCVLKAEIEKRKINIADVLQSAKEWYDQDKSINLSPEQIHVCNQLISLAVIKEETRGFYVEEHIYQNSCLPALVDARILHIITKRTRIPDGTGKQYHLLVLDYSTFVNEIMSGKPIFLFDQEPYERLCAKAAGCIMETSRSRDKYFPFDKSKRIRNVIIVFDENGMPSILKNHPKRKN